MVRCRSRPSKSNNTNNKQLRSRRFTMMEDDQGPSFDANYISVKELVGADGGLLLPKEDKDRVQLAGWLLDLKEGPTSMDTQTLTDRQKEIAEVMTYYEKTSRVAKFDWIWYGRFCQLLHYQHEYHTFTVSKRDEKHKKLRSWVLKQREIGKNNTLHPKRKKLLLDIGFDFFPCVVSRKRKHTPQQNEAWNEMFGMLVNFKDKHGHCNVCFYDTTNRKLAVWINTQRSSYKKGKMVQDRKDRLDSLGFVWSIRGPPKIQDVSDVKNK